MMIKKIRDTGALIAMIQVFNDLRNLNETMRETTATYW